MLHLFYNLSHFPLTLCVMSALETNFAVPSVRIAEEDYHLRRGPSAATDVYQADRDSREDFFNH
jgi:hypothetical protein